MTRLEVEMIMTEEIVYTVEEVAKMLKVSKETVRRMVRDGELEAVHVRQRVRISKEALDKYLKKG